MFTYQDFLKYRAINPVSALGTAINQHMAGETYRMAVAADEYARQRNITINRYTKLINEYSNNPLVNVTAANSRIASNFFYRLNIQRCSYSLGNGITFPEEGIKERLGSDFDNTLYRAGYYGLIHGETYGYWDYDRLYNFPVTEFVPLYDEYTGQLRAGIRFWTLGASKPYTVVLYEEDGITKYQSKTQTAGFDLIQTEEKHGYIQRVASSGATGELVVGYENYPSLPIVPLYGSRRKQSTLIGLQEAIDSFDLIQSGFANDLQDCAQIYWIIENCGGMNRTDLQEFLARLKYDHIATADTGSMGVDSASLKPYAQEMPYGAREAYLNNIRNSIYEGFGALDVHSIAASSTNDHIDAAYQPMDEEADDFEYQVIGFVRSILHLMGLDSIPTFKRNRISNMQEQTDMVISAYNAGLLDTQAAVNHLPFVTVDEVDGILQGIGEEQGERLVDE